MILYYCDGDDYVRDDWEYDADEHEVSDFLEDYLKSLNSSTLAYILLDNDGLQLDLREWFRDEITEYFKKEAYEYHREPKD